MPNDPLRYNLGAGRQAYEHPGFISVDKIWSEGVDIVHDCELGLPSHIQSNSVDEFLCRHFLEHIHNLIPLMDAMWVALKPVGTLHIFVPNAHHVRAAWSDPTHVRAFTPETFDYFTHGTLAAYPYTDKEWEILERHVNGTPPDDLWEVEVVMSPVK